MSSRFIDDMDFRPKAIGQQLTSLLKEAIVNGELAGGEKLVERDLEKKFGVSRSPIREAIRDLEKMGLVDIVPRKGTVVKVITKKDIEESHIVRAPLEGLAAKYAFLNMDEKDRVALRKALQQMRVATESQDHDGFWASHNKFHSTFINACGLGLLSALLRMLRLHSYRHRMVFPHQDDDFDSHLANHVKIMDMFDNPQTDPDKLERFVIDHIDKARDRFLASIK
ncbi:GntR family transcriptional regulator [Desulfoferula mesophila]|uniref:GntR family transcriptional regulator n=1 Tax=Desulfoferula mesophila TaxID=3058419 RepID=A0AAU9F366_9BACT|nr:GntR family transcriptional regulator [Desulfoferula mesophilus]